MHSTCDSNPFKVCAYVCRINGSRAVELEVCDRKSSHGFALLAVATPSGLFTNVYCS